jgi:hypothetical protein
LPSSHETCFAGLPALEYNITNTRPMRMIPTRTATVFGALALIVLAAPACYYSPPPEPYQSRPLADYPSNPNPGYPEPPRNDGRYGPGESIPDDTYSPYGPPPRETAPEDDIPVARPTGNPNRVISPHPPYNVVDITGFKPGELARDPTIEGKKIFRVP